MAIDDDDGITGVWTTEMGWAGSVGNVRIVSDDGKEWIAREALRERWLEGGARWETAQGEMVRKHAVLIGDS